MYLRYKNDLKRRLLSFALSVALVLSLLPTGPLAKAEDTAPVRWQIGEPYDAETEESIAVEDVDELCETYLDCVKRRVGSFELTMQVESTVEEYQSTYQAIYEEVENRTKAVFETHTGVPDEGDYIRYQTGGYGCSCSGSVSALDNGNLLLDISFYFNNNYYTTADEEQAVTERLGEVMDELDLGGKSTYFKIKAIHDYIVRNVTYDFEHLGDTDYKTQFTAYGALIDGTAVCQGYALLFYRMCLEAGVDVRIVIGEAQSDEGREAHAWNIAKVGSLYYYVDVTWDDPYVEGGDPGDIYTDYFLAGSNTIGTDHFPDEEFLDDDFIYEYPVSDEDYEYSYYDDYPDDEPSLVSQSATLGGQIEANLLMKLPEIEGCNYEDSYMEFVILDYEERAEIDAFDPNDRSKDGRLFKFSVHVSSIQMADLIQVFFHYYVNGYEEVQEYYFKLQDYLIALEEREDSSPELIELARAVREYGYFAQRYLSVYSKNPWMYGSAHKIMDGFSDGHTIDPSPDLGEFRNYEKDLAEDVRSVKMSLTLDSDTAINLFVNTAEGYSGGVTAFINGDPEVGALKVSKESLGLYKITIPGIAAHKLGEPFDVTIQTDGGESFLSLSALTYACICVENETHARDVMLALYYYYEAACAYVMSLNS